VRNLFDPTGDIDDLCAIIRSNEMELSLIDSWLSELNGSSKQLNARENLLELRSLCLLRNRLLLQVEKQHLFAESA
jgi:hypothetical protein